jgi:dTDP-4-amino-4,6-dideoxygalactose transaminase
MKVPFVDLRTQHRQIGPELRQAFERVLERSSFILGPEVERFEAAFSSYLNVTECVAVNSGTAALQLALEALDIGPGHEVITVPYTFIATAEAIWTVRARPVFVDVDPVSYTMDPGQVERAITGRTRALVPVHLYGQPADMDPLLELARRYKLALVEDACQAHGAEYKGRKAGSLGTAGCFSFYPSKNLGGCGEGGAVVTNDPQLAERVRLLRNHGSVSKYEHRFPGYNFRMEGLQAAFLAVKLPRLDEWNERRRKLAQHYDRLLSDSGGGEGGSRVSPPAERSPRRAVQPDIVIPREMPYAKHVYHLYVIQADDRVALRQRLAGQGIEAGLHYSIPLHLQEAFRWLGHRQGDFPVCERLAQRILSLPMYPDLTDEALDYVASAVLESSRCPMTEVS